MKIQQITVASTFQLEASRDDLEALDICLQHTYHYGHNKIPKHLVSATSQLMGTVEKAIRKNDDIQRQIRERS